VGAVNEREWLDLVAELMAAPLTRWPAAQIALMLTESFAAPGCGFDARSAGQPFSGGLWPEARWHDRLDELVDFAVHEAATRHPLLRYYLATGETRAMQTSDVPALFAGPRIVAEWNELGRRWGGVQSQLALPLVMTQQTRRTFVVGRADAFTAQEMRLARTLRRLLSGLDRQVTVAARWSEQATPHMADVAESIRLTPRELAVLTLLADGLTAGAIGRRLLIAERTVQKHLERCYTKLGVADRLAAVLRAQHLGLLLAAEPRRA
jgi:DNA-binding CsgD family transcriptional regulator